MTNTPEKLKLSVLHMSVLEQIMNFTSQVKPDGTLVPRTYAGSDLGTLQIVFAELTPLKVYRAAVDTRREEFTNLAKTDISEYAKALDVFRAAVADCGKDEDKIEVIMKAHSDFSASDPKISIDRQLNDDKDLKEKLDTGWTFDLSPAAFDLVQKTIRGSEFTGSNPILLDLVKFFNV